MFFILGFLTGVILFGLIIVNNKKKVIEFLIKEDAK